ncbi:MAG: diacylglycerol kinase family lipid kinase [Deltaproteobacteria bacterium]|nr:diacylglycerol kinase family lipid kinase [Deltaproteobacteria bacterium]
MTIQFKTLAIVNPGSASGATGRKWPAIQRLMETKFQDGFHVAFTRGPLHATELTRRYLEQGYEMIVAVGGDGTINEVVNGFFEKGENLFPQAVLGILSVGSGADFPRTLGWDRNISHGVERLTGTRTKPVDVGRATFRNLRGLRETRCFINMADFGAGGAVVEKVNRTTKLLGGTFSFLWGILSTLPGYRNKEVTFVIDDGPARSAVLNNMIVANGKYYGGGIKAAPDALIDDGLFQFVLIGDVTFGDVLLYLHRFRRGTHLTHPEIESYAGRSMSATSKDPVFIEMDGELAGTLPVIFEVLPKALRIKV